MRWSVGASCWRAGLVQVKDDLLDGPEEKAGGWRFVTLPAKLLEAVPLEILTHGGSPHAAPQQPPPA